MRLVPELGCACLLLAGGCATEPACTQGIEPGIVVEIRDAFDDAPLAERARGAVQQGSFVDSLRPYASVGNGVLISRAAADERPGVYSVTVSHEGYLDWSVQGVPVSPGTCNVRTERLSAYLQRSP